MLPTGDAGPVVAVNKDVGETIGWPDLPRTVAGVRDPGRAVILARNYGEAGAIDRYGASLGLPRAHSGHNAHADWGPPPGDGGPVITVGLRPAQAAEHLVGCAPAARIDNRAGVDNQERGALVMVCAGPRRPWRREWPALRRLG